MICRCFEHADTFFLFILFNDLLGFAALLGVKLMFLLRNKHLQRRKCLSIQC